MTSLHAVAVIDTQLARKRRHVHSYCQGRFIVELKHIYLFIYKIVNQHLEDTCKTNFSTKRISLTPRQKVNEHCR